MNPTLSGLSFGSEEFNQANATLAQGSLTPVYSVLPNPLGGGEDTLTYADPFINNFFGQVETMAAVNIAGEADRQYVYSPEELKRKYNLDATVPMNGIQADIMAAKNTKEAQIAFRKKYLDDSISMGQFKAGARDFITGGLGAIASPSNIATGFAFAPLKAAGWAVPLLAEGLAEAAGGFGLRKYGYNYGALDAALDVVAPVALVGIGRQFKSSFGKLKRHFGYDGDLLSQGKVSTPLVKDIYNKDLKIDNEGLTYKAVDNLETKVEVDLGGKTISKIKAPDKGYVVVSGKSFDPLNTGFSNNGITFTTDIQLAKNQSAPSIEASSGKVAEVSLSKDASIIDGTKRFNEYPTLKDSIYKKLIDSEFANEIEDSDLDGTIEAFMDGISKSADLEGSGKLLDMVQEAFTENGIDGLAFNAKGIDGAPLNNGTKGIHVFNQDKVDFSKVESTTMEVKAKSKEFVEPEIDNAIELENAKESHVFHNQSLWDEINNIKESDIEVESFFNMSMKELEDTLAELEIDLTSGSTKLEGKIVKGGNPELTSTERLREIKVQLDQALKAGVFCVKGN